MQRALAAPLAFLVAGAASCCASEKTFTVRSPASEAPPPAAPLAPPLVRALHFGDFGATTCQQGAVADGLAAEARRAPVDLALAVGDNLYDCGPSLDVPGAGACSFAADGATVAEGFAPAPDASFARQHEEPLEGLAGIPVHLALGNHDVEVRGSCSPADRAPDEAARLKACLEVAHRSGLWSMPGRHYAVDAGRARFIVVDTNAVVGSYGGFDVDGEVAFVAEAASAERCPPEKACFLVGHHPPASAGSHGGNVTPDYLARMERVIAAGGGRIRAWLAGHEHDLQHLRTVAGLDVLVSGNAARARSGERFQDVSAPGAAVLFGSVRWGHGVVEVGADGWSYRFSAHDGKALHCCVARGAGPCEPAACAR